MFSDAILSALKRALKAKEVTYKDLADHLKLSESGVKKMLTAKDLSLSRLMEICDWLGISAADLVGLAEKEDVREVELTSEQVKGLSQDPLLFRVFWRLTEQEGLLSVARAEGLPAAELKKKLLRLERLELLRVHADGRVSLKHRGLYRWRAGNPLVDRLHRDWSILTVERALKAPESIPSLHRLSSLPLTAESLKDLLQSLNNVVDEFARRSRREELLSSREKLKPFSLVIAGISKKFTDGGI